ncbi:MAG: thiamine pyrophosphate-dependent enzyme [Cyanophyceae cyanobacterium]
MTENLTQKQSFFVENHNGDGNNRQQDAIASTSNGNGTASLTVAQALVKALEALGVREAFGVSGGAMATLWGALSNSPLIEVLHCRHESGATFAATEAHFASNRPVVSFSTASPGITNSLTGLMAARDEGAKVIHFSACTSAPQRGRWAIQETSEQTIPQGGIFTSGALFNYATVLESPQQLPQIARRLALGVSQRGTFVAHISIPTAVQSAPMTTAVPEVNLAPDLSVPSQKTVSKVAALLSEGPFAIWVGYGARGAAQSILQLAEKTGAAVMCSPRGKGVFPENHAQFVGVTGLGGHESVLEYLQDHRPHRTLVIGTRLGEPTSFWSHEMVPAKGFIHVDIDPKVPGVAYPFAQTYPVIADADVFVQALLNHLPPSEPGAFPTPEKDDITLAESNLVRPEILMEAIQRVVVEGSDAVVLAESGNSFTWATHFLRFPQPNRYRVSTGVGSMGHNVTGVVGAAQGRNGKAVAIAGDGAMLMNSGEISTAVKYQLPAVWIVLNDAYYNMCNQGMQMLGMTGADAKLPETDFSLIARGMGAQGIRVTAEAGLAEALQQAIAAAGPVVVDVLIDPTRFAPSKGRNKSLSAQGVKTTPQDNHEEKQVSFPLV